MDSLPKRVLVTHNTNTHNSIKETNRRNKQKKQTEETNKRNNQKKQHIKRKSKRNIKKK